MRKFKLKLDVLLINGRVNRYEIWLLSLFFGLMFQFLGLKKILHPVPGLGLRNAVKIVCVFESSAMVAQSSLQNFDRPFYGG